MSKILRLAITGLGLAAISGCHDIPMGPGFNCHMGVDYVVQERQFQVCAMSRPDKARSTWVKACKRAATEIAQRRICMPANPIKKMPVIPPDNVKKI